MHGYPVMQVVQYSVPPCSWPPPVDSHRSSQPTSVSARSGIRKYVVWCLICGGLSCLLGIMFLGVYFLVRSYTSTIGYFETVPTFVPATLLMLTGLCIISLARRRNRYSYLIKLSGACGLSSALTCALVTVTTTVIHMSRLQALRECEYTRKTRTCTCYSVETTHTIQDDGSNLGGNDEIGYRFVFDSADECTVVHNALYSCLRAIFGISVAGVLVAVFSCMLVYQLLSHERKKMIWEQLELRRRQAYGQSPPGWPPLGNGPSIIGTPRNGPCRCCEQCHSHRNMLQSSYSWDSDRFWSAPPNGYYGQGADDHLIVSRMVNQQTQRPGWSWPRFPWQRNDNQQRFRQTPSSPDSQYGFSTNVSRLENNTTNMMQSYTLINNPHHFGIWGPPPPYSDPNSPVRRNRYLYNHCQPITEHSSVVIQPMTNVSHQPNLASMDCTQPIVSDTHSIEQICATPTHTINHRIKNRSFKDTAEPGTLSDSDTQRDSMHSNTLPFRKARKKIENGAKSIGANQSTSRVNVQNIFSSTQSIGSRMTENNGGIGGSGGILGGSSSNGNIGGNGLRTISTATTAMNDNIPGCSSANFTMHSKMKNSFENTGYQSMEDIIGRTQTINGFTANNGEQTMNANGNRDMFTRSRLAFHNRGDYEKFGTFNANVQQAYATLSPHNNHSGANSNSSHSLPKDLTRYSICSAESEKTEYTDVSPMLTPSTPYTTDDSNAITLAFQREMKQQQQQQQQQQHHQQLQLQQQQQKQQQQQQRSFNQVKDHSEASASTSTSLYSARYLDGGGGGGGEQHKRDSSNMLRTKNTVPDIHIRAATHLLSPVNLTVSDSNDPTPLDQLNGSSGMYSKYTERRSVYQRPTYSFASGHSSSSGGHSHHSHSSSTVKHTMLSTATPKKRNLYANHSVGSPRSTMTGGDIDLVRLTNMRKEAAAAAAAASAIDEIGGKTKDEQRKAYESHSKVLNENDWPDHNNDRRL